MSTPVFPSPNFGNRRDGASPDLIVLHSTGMESHEAAHARLCDPASEVSAHYLIGMDGSVSALVSEANRAWHAGAGEWVGITDVNSRSIGIELSNPGQMPFAERQMAALAEVMAGVMTRWQIAPHRVIAHSDMAPRRKRDPGPRFDWRRLALMGLSVWPEAGQPGDFIADARRFGYPDAGDDLVLGAFRLRFRPWAKGPLDAVDAGLMANLADRFGLG